MSAQKTERLLNLVICLLSTRQFLLKEQIRRAVPQYAECPNDEAFDRMFERDKDELRDMGVPLETGSNNAWFEDEVGYRVDGSAYALPEVRFEPDELAVLALAARVWQQASLAAPAARALLKLRAESGEPDSESLVGIEPLVSTSEIAFDRVYAAVRDRQAIRFPYRGYGASDDVQRHVEPWGVVSRNGRWYLVGHDRDRDATRVFRLSRIVGQVSPTGPVGAVVVPEGVDVRREVAAMAPPVPVGEAVLSVRPGAGHGLRRRALRVTEGGDWDEVVVAVYDPDMLAEQVSGYGPTVRVESPAQLRAAVVRRLTGAIEAHAGLRPVPAEQR